MVKIVRLFKKDIESLIELSLLVDCSHFKIVDYSEWAYWLLQGMKIWGIKDGNKLVAIGSLSYYDIPGKSMGIEDYRLVTLTNGQVHPDYRGRGYQKVLIFIRIISALWEGIYRIQSLVKINNVVCIKNLEKMSFSNQGQYEEDGDQIYIFEFNNQFFINLFKVLNKILGKLRA